MLALAVPVLFIAACDITGQTSKALNEDIIGCSINTDVDFLQINDLVQACHRGSSLYFIIENTGTTQVSGLDVHLLSDYNITMLIKEQIEPGGTSQQNLNFGSQEITGSMSLTIYPAIGEARTVCRGSGITTMLNKC